MTTKQSKAELFLELAKPNSKGFSRPVYVSEFVGKYARLKTTNGGDWCRSDGSLGRRFNLRREIVKGKIYFIELHGFNKKPIGKCIPSWIRQALDGKRCVVLGISRVEIDHKDGRLDDPRLNDVKQLRIDDFQPLSKAVNKAKRQHCKECRATNLRFDATRLGFLKAQVEGDGDYRGSCVGCYWHDPQYFVGKCGK